MKKVRLKVLKNYKDLSLNRTVKKGEFITVTEDRAKKILQSKEKLAEIVQVETNPLPKAAQVTSRIKPKVVVVDEKGFTEHVNSKPKKAKVKTNNAPDKGKKD